MVRPESCSGDRGQFRLGQQPARQTMRSEPPAAGRVVSSAPTRQRQGMSVMGCRSSAEHPTALDAGSVLTSMPSTWPSQGDGAG